MGATFFLRNTNLDRFVECRAQLREEMLGYLTTKSVRNCVGEPSIGPSFPAWTTEGSPKLQPDFVASGSRNAVGGELVGWIEDKWLGTDEPADV